MGKTPLVSIIIPTRDSEKLLPSCLGAIFRQSYDNLEVIVIDSSHDDTKNIAKKYGCVVISEDVVMTKARNIGTKHSHGQYIFHLDADIRIDDPETISDCLLLCEKGADAVFIPQAFNGTGFWGECRKKEFQLYQGYSPLRVARFIRRNVLESIGGYDETLISGEDWDMTQKLVHSQHRIAISNAIMIHGWGSLSPSKLVRKSYQYGKTVSRYARKHPAATTEQWGPSRFVFLFKASVRHYPKYSIGILLLKTFEFGAGLVGIVSEKFGKS